MKKGINKKNETIRCTAIRSRFILVIEKINYVMFVSYSERNGANVRFCALFGRLRRYL